jgi:transposase
LERIADRLQAHDPQLERFTTEQHIERCFNRRKRFRRVATRYEKREVNYLAMVKIAAIVLLWLG